MNKRSCTLAIWCLCLVAMLPWTHATTVGSQANHETEKTEAAMNLAQPIESDAPTIPPIDAAAPVVFETASFGLG